MCLPGAPTSTLVLRSEALLLLLFVFVCAFQKFIFIFCLQGLQSGRKEAATSCNMWNRSENGGFNIVNCKGNVFIYYMKKRGNILLAGSLSYTQNQADNKYPKKWKKGKQLNSEQHSYDFKQNAVVLRSLFFLTPRNKQKSHFCLETANCCCYK